MKIINLRLKIGLLIGLFVYLFIGSITTRASSLSLSLDPSIIEIHAIPPSTAKADLKVRNSGNSEVNFSIQLKPFEPRFENGDLEYFNPEDSLILKNVQVLDNGIPVDDVTLGPSQEKILTLNINIPEDTTISDYYFSIMFISQNKLTPTSTSSLNQLGIAANILLSVGALETPDAVLEEFSSNLFYEKGPVQFMIRIKNKGEHFIRPKGEIIIKNMFGQSVGKLDLASINVLTDSIRAIPQAKTLWNESFLLGFYTATLNMRLSDDGPTFVKPIHFFAFPFQAMIAIVIAAIIIIIIRNKLKIYMKK